MIVENKSQKTLIIIGGPTGIGKSNLSMQLAENLQCSIISADSRQVYKQLDIGTAKPSIDDLDKVKHYCVDLVDLTDIYSAGRFEKDAEAAIEQAHKTHHSVIMCGGTGLYINALLNGLDEFPDITESARKLVKSIETHEGTDGLIKELKRVDVESANTLDLQNTRRIERALQVYHSSQIKYSDWKAKKKERVHPYRILSYWLNTDRQPLYDKINTRTLKMLDNGWIEEVKGLVKYRKERALDTVGYKEIFRYLDGDLNYQTLVSEIQKQTRRYAKRQITWFGNQYDGKELYFDKSSLELLSSIESEIIDK